MMEINENENTFSNEKAGSQNKTIGLSENAKKLVSLIVKIIVNATIRECDEESNKISKV